MRTQSKKTFNANSTLIDSPMRSIIFTNAKHYFYNVTKAYAFPIIYVNGIAVAIYGLLERFTISLTIHGQP